jgi:Fe-S cluster assembly protein SufD
MASSTSLDLKAQFLAPFEALLEGTTLAPLHKERAAALQVLMEQDLPTQKHEEWKYFPLKSLFETSFETKTDTQIDETEFEPFLIPNLEANLLVFVNGKLAFKGLKENHRGLRIATFSEIAQEKPDLLEKHFNQYTGFESNFFAKLNTATTQEGMLIEIPKNTTLRYPLVLLWVSKTEQANLATQVRNLVLVGENSQAKIIQQNAVITTKSEQKQGKNWTNSVTEIALERYAHLEHYRLQDDPAQDFYIGSTFVRQADNSHFEDFTFSFAGRLIRNNLVLALGSQVEGYMNGLYLPDSQCVVDNHTAVAHEKPNSYSNQLYKGILGAQSKAVFNGKIFVMPGAQKTNAFQSNKNILLEDSAIIDTKPQLEIWADDVKCSHGATTGAVDRDSIFYLRARGIPEKQAKALLVQAFALEVVEKIKIEALKNHIEQKIYNRLS